MSTTSSRISARRSRARRGWALGLWLALAALLVLGGFYGQSQGPAESDILYDAGLAVSGLVGYGLLILVTLAIGRLYRRPLDALGFRRFRMRWVWIGLGLVLLTLIVGAILEPVLHGGREQGITASGWEPEHATAFALNCVVLVLFGPFAEEVFFRGLGVRALGVFGGLVAIVVSGIVFGLAHGILGALPPLALFGIALGWVRFRSASVWPSYIAHATYNGLAILILVLSWTV
jgi:hypothetical protein